MLLLVNTRFKCNLYDSIGKWREKLTHQAGYAILSYSDLNNTVKQLSEQWVAQ